MSKSNFSFKIEELSPVATWCNSLLKQYQADFKDYSTDFADPYPADVEAKIEAVNELISTKLFIGELSTATQKLYNNMDESRPLILQLEGYIKRTEKNLTTPAKSFDLKLLRKCISSKDAEGFNMSLKLLLQLVNANISVLQDKGMKPALVTKLTDILTKNYTLSQEQNSKMLDKEKAVKENADILNDLWKDCQNIMDAGKRIYKYSNPDMLKNFTLTHIRKTMNHSNNKKTNDNNSDTEKAE